MVDCSVRRVVSEATNLEHTLQVKLVADEHVLGSANRLAIDCDKRDGVQALTDETDILWSELL